MQRLLAAIYLFQWAWHVAIAAQQRDALLALWMAQCGVLVTSDDDGGVCIRSATRMSLISRFIVLSRFRQGPRFIIALALMQNVCRLFRLLAMTKAARTLRRMMIYKMIWGIHTLVGVFLILGVMYRNIFAPIESGTRLSGFVRVLLFLATTPGRHTIRRQNVNHKKDASCNQDLCNRRKAYGVPSFFIDRRGRRR